MDRSAHAASYFHQFWGQCATPSPLSRLMPYPSATRYYRHIPTCIRDYAGRTFRTISASFAITSAPGARRSINAVSSLASVTPNT